MNIPVSPGRDREEIRGVDDVGEGVDVVTDKLNPLGGPSGLGDERVGMKSLAV